MESMCNSYIEETKKMEKALLVGNALTNKQILEIIHTLSVIKRQFERLEVEIERAYGFIEKSMSYTAIRDYGYNNLLNFQRIRDFFLELYKKATDENTFDLLTVEHEKNRMVVFGDNTYMDIKTMLYKYKDILNILNLVYKERWEMFKRYIGYGERYDDCDYNVCLWSTLLDEDGGTKGYIRADFIEGSLTFSGMLYRIETDYGRSNLNYSIRCGEIDIPISKINKKTHEFLEWIKTYYPQYIV